MFFFAAALPAKAHESHPVEASLRLEPGRYVLSMPFDVPTLMLSRTLNHTDAGEAARELSALTPEERERALAQAERYLRISLRIEIDGERSVPEIELPSFEPGPLGRLGDPTETFYVRMSGDFPAGSRAMTLTPGRALREWRVVPIAIGGGRLPPLLLTGGITGPPISLEPPPPLPPSGRVWVDQLVASARAVFLLMPALPLFLLGVLLLDPRATTMAGQLLPFASGVLLTLGLAGFGVLDVPQRVVDVSAAFSVVAVAGDGLLSGRHRVWRPSLLFAAGLCFGHGVADALSVDTTLLPRPGTAFGGWTSGFLAAGFAISIPIALILLAAARHGLWARLRTPLMALTLLLGLATAIAGLGPLGS